MVKARQQPYERIDRDVARRYAVETRIGRGCYGVVFAVTQIAGPQQGRRLALKKVLYAFKESADAQRTYREISYLLEFGNHENILSVHDVLCSPDDRHLYIVSDYLDSDLQKALRSQALQAVHRPLIAYQILRALKYIHSAEVMHRDVKPSNVLLSKECDAVLADFGWARAAPIEAVLDGLMTEYASTRWYRPPEMLLGARRYNTSVDMWAFGCVVAEMHGETALYDGTSTIDMLSLIVVMLGKPLSADIAALEAPFASFSLDCLPPVPPNKTLDMTFHGEAPELVDLLKLLLQWNPGKRFTAVEAMQHPYVGPFRNPDDEPVFGHALALALPDEERHAGVRYRNQIYADVLGFPRAKSLVRKQHLPPFFDETAEEDGGTDGELDVVMPDEP